MKVGDLFELNRDTLASYNYRHSFTFGEVVRDETNTFWTSPGPRQVTLDFTSDDTYILVDRDQPVYASYKDPNRLHYIFFSIKTNKCFTIRIDREIDPRRWLVEINPQRIYENE